MSMTQGLFASLMIGNTQEAMDFSTTILESSLRGHWTGPAPESEAGRTARRAHHASECIRHGQHVHPGVDGFLTYGRQQKLCYIAGGDKSLRGYHGNHIAC